MEDGRDSDDVTLDLRVSDLEREAMVDILRRQTTAGRLTLGEFEERLGEVYAARTRRDLEGALRELPVEPPPMLRGRPGKDAAAEPITEGDLRARYHVRVRKELAEFVAPNFVCNAIWIMGDGNYWWPGWVLMGTGVGLISMLIRGFDPEKERAALAAQRRKEGMAAIEARHAPEPPNLRQ